MTLSINAVTSPAPASPLRTTAPTGVFALSLAQIARAPVAGKDADPPPDPHGKDDDTRQDDAADGNGVPVGAALQPDPSLLAAWLPPLPVPVSVGGNITVPAGTATTAADPAAAAAALAAPSADAGGTTAQRISNAVPAPIPAAGTLPGAPAAGALPGAPAAGALPGAPAAGALPDATSITAAAPVSTSGVTIVSTPSTTATDTRDLTPQISTPQIDTRAAPVVALPPAQTPTMLPQGAGTTTTSAIQAFGAAMHAGLVTDPRADTADDTPGPLTAAAATHAAATPAVAATGDAQQAPLDLRRENWPHAMIDRIEALRDAADATSTKIRVVPDALGPVAMSVRKDGDTIHVHFTADQAATRAILTDAQPRLAAIAEQRGLRIGGSSVDAGNAGTGQQQQHAATRQPVAPASTPSVPVTTDDDDIRLA